MTIGAIEIHPAFNVLGGQVGHQPVRPSPGGTGPQIALIAGRRHKGGEVYRNGSLSVPHRPRKRRSRQQVIVRQGVRPVGEGRIGPAAE